MNEEPKTSPITTYQTWIDMVRSEGGDDFEGVKNALECQAQIEKLIEQESPLWILPANLRFPVLVRKPTGEAYRAHSNRISEIWRGGEQLGKKQERDYAATVSFAMKNIAFPVPEMVTQIAQQNYDLFLQVNELLKMIARDDVVIERVKLKRL